MFSGRAGLPPRHACVGVEDHATHPAGVATLPPERPLTLRDFHS